MLDVIILLVFLGYRSVNTCFYSVYGEMLGRVARLEAFSLAVFSGSTGYMAVE